MRVETRASDLESINFNFIKHDRIWVRPMYYELGLSRLPDIYGRRVVFNKLLLALAMIPSRYGLAIWDIYRPREVQTRLFEWMRAEIRKTQPHLSPEENYHETKKYVAPPSKVGDAYCPPHLSGGAIDLTLFELCSGQEVDMGTKFDDCTERAHRDYFENAPSLNVAEQGIKSNRSILRSAMEYAGFTTYQYEWWHYDFGNLFWEKATGQQAIFGPLFGNLEWPQNIDAIAYDF